MVLLADVSPHRELIHYFYNRFPQIVFMKNRMNKTKVAVINIFTPSTTPTVLFIK